MAPGGQRRRIEQAEVQRLLAHVDIVGLVEQHTKVERDGGQRYQACCLFHDDRSPSLKLFPDQASYHCFGCGANGNAIGLVQHLSGCDFLAALRVLARETGYWPEGLDDDGKPAPKVEPKERPVRVKPDKRRKLEVITPVPDYGAKLRPGGYFAHAVKRWIDPTALWAFRDGGGQLLGYDVRYEWTTKDGERGKAVITWTWCRNIDTQAEQWKQKAWPDPSPLYGLDRLEAMPGHPVIITEGCKAAAAAQELVPYAVAMTWRGGAQTVVDRSKNDWRPLAGRQVIIWPDADDPGMKAAWHVADHCRQVGAASVQVVDVSDLPKGWDLADVA